MATGILGLEDDELNLGDSNPSSLYKTFNDANQQVNHRAAELRLGRPVEDKQPSISAPKPEQSATISYQPLFSDIGSKKETQSAPAIQPKQDDGAIAYQPLFSDLTPEKKPGLLSRIGTAVDTGITNAFGENKPDQSKIDEKGMEQYKAQEAEQNALVAKRRLELGTDNHGYAMKMFDSAAAGFGSAVSGTLEWIGDSVGSNSIRDLAQAGKREAMALTPRDQDTAQKLAGAVGSMLAFVAPGTGAVKGLQLAGVGLKAARVAGAGAAALLESAGVAQETYEKAMSETGNKDHANEQAWKAASVNLPLNWAMNKIGLFGESGSAAKQIGMTFLTEGAEEGSQNMITNKLGYKPVGEGVSEATAIGGLAGGGFKGGALSLEKLFAESTPEQKDALVKGLIDDGSYARQQVFEAMMQDEHAADILQKAGIQDANDARFQGIAEQIGKLDGSLTKLDTEHKDESKPDTNSAGFVAEPKEQLQAQVAAVADGRKPAAVMGVEEAAGVDAPGLFKHEITDPQTGDKSVVVSKSEDFGQKVQARVDEVGLKQAMGEALGYVEPAATTEKNPDSVVVQQRDKQSGQIITEQAVSTENVDKVPPVDGTTTSVKSVEGAIKERQQEQAPAVSPIDEAAHQAATSPMNEKPQPTEAQKKAGNYGKGHVKLHGMDIAIENPQGSERSGVAPDGKAWSMTMANHYGYVKGTVGNDKDHVDVFIGPNHSSNKVFVVDQVNPDGSFDEHKALLGFDSEADARAGYLANYEKGWTGLGAISEMPAQAFRSWVKDGKKGKPLALAAPAVATESVQQTEVTAPEKPVAKQTVEQKLKEKQKAKVAEKAKEENAKSESKPAPAPVADAKAEVAQSKVAEKPVAKADKETAKAKQDTKAREEPRVKAEPKPNAKQIKLEAIDSWENNDDGVTPHIPFNKLPKAAQDSWITAYHPEDGEKSYSSADYHDEIVNSVLRSARHERLNAKMAAARKADTDLDSVFRVKTVGDTGMSKAAVDNIVEMMVSKWANLPEIKVVETEDDLPIRELTRIKREDMSGKVPGMYLNGKVWLVAGNIHNGEDAIKTVAHEVTGHFGLRSIFGEKHAETMLKLYNSNASIRKTADAMMVKEGLSKVIATEEALADMAERDPADLVDGEKSALRKLYEAIRAWLRDNFGIKYVSDEEVRQIVANARAYVIDGNVEEGKGGTAAAQQSVKDEAAAQRATGAATFYSALERGFRSSKQENMPADQWKSWLASKAPSLGIRKEEIEWTGINDWLDLEDQQGRKVTKQEVLNFVGANKIKLNDILLTEGRSGISDEDLYEMVEQMDEDPSYMTRDEMLDLVASHYGWKRKVLGEARHRKYTEEGGQDYVELILQDPTAKSYKAGDKIHFGDASEGKAIGWLRMITRSDARGEPVLFLEEIQSQRGQDGRDKGFGEEDGQVPDAPFVKDTKAWTALLLKRAIAYAQQQGIAKIAWTHGDQQVERYRLSKSIDSVNYKSSGDGKWDIVAKKGDTNVVNKNSLSEKELAATLGKDMADVIVASEKSEGSIGGVDLDIGGDGVRHYYNSVVPSVAKSVIKDFGGSVEVMDIAGTGQQLGFNIPEKLQKQVEEDGLPLFRLREYEEQFADLPPHVRAMAIAKGFVSPPKYKERFEALKKDFAKRLVQGVFDKFRPIKDISEKAYMMVRMSNGPQDGALATALNYGQVYDDGGALRLKEGTKGLMKILEPVGGEVDRFLLWVAANRAGELKKQDREHFFSDEEISNLKRLNLGSMKGGKSRAATYIKTLQEMNEMNRSILDLAKEKGLIDEAAYKKFAADVWYVPFYRQMDDDRTLSAAQTSTGHVSQYLSKRLKGSTRGLNDLLENVLLNWSHIMSASMKNAAAVETLNYATQAGGIVSKLTKIDDKFGKDADGNAVPLKYTVMVMEKGKPVHYEVKDELLLTALDKIATIGGSNFFLDVARPFKTTLTRFISLSPTFKINNLVRDSVQSLALSDNGFSPITNALDGYRSYKTDRADPLAAGALFAMGNAFDGDQSASVKRIVKSGVPSEDVLTTADKAKDWFLKQWDKYDEVSDAMENANRINLYNQTLAKGGTHLEAAYAARDLQDFSLQGSWEAIRWASQVLPYFNARLQGLYKIGRDGIDPVRSVMFGEPTDSERKKAAKFGMVLGAITVIELALYLAQKDDDDWKKREEWDKDAFYWFKIPGTDKAVRVPKPFELGAIGTAIGRAAEQIVDSSVEGKVFSQRMLALLHDNLAINPVPQFYRPVADLQSNKDSFTGRPIESMGMERLSKANRVNAGTSNVGVGLAKINQVGANIVSAVTGANAENLQLSPIQMDYALRGYLGWVGTVMQESSDFLLNPLKAGETPDKRVDDLFIIGNFVKTMPQSQSKYITSFYENAKEISTAASDYRMYLNSGEAEKAAELMAEKRDLIGLNKVYSQTADNLAKVGKRIKMVQDNEQMDGAAKRVEIDRLNALKSDIAKRTEEMRQMRLRAKD